MHSNKTVNAQRWAGSFSKFQVIRLHFVNKSLRNLELRSRLMALGDSGIKKNLSLPPPPPHSCWVGAVSEVGVGEHGVLLPHRAEAFDGVHEFLVIHEL